MFIWGRSVCHSIDKLAYSFKKLIQMPALCQALGEVLRFYNTEDKVSNFSEIHYRVRSQGRGGRGKREGGRERYGSSWMDQSVFLEEECPSWNLERKEVLPGKVEIGRQMGITWANEWSHEIQGTFREQCAACSYWSTRSAGVRGRNWQGWLWVGEGWVTVSSTQQMFIELCYY